MKYLLLLLFSVNVCLADTLPSHALMGGLSTGAMVKLSGGSKTDIWIGFGIGSLLGALPDIGGAVGGSLQGDWEAYHRFHRFDTVISFIPQVRLHLWVDEIYHDKVHGGWKNGMITVAVITLIVEGVLLYYFIKWVK